MRMNKNPSLLFDNMNNNNIFVSNDTQGSPLRRPTHHQYVNGTVKGY